MGKVVFQKFLVHFMEVLKCSFELLWTYWASQLAQCVKNPSAMQESSETQVRSSGGDYTLKEGMATHSSMLAWRIPWTEEPVGYSPWGRKVSETTEATVYAHTLDILVGGNPNLAFL